MRALFFVLLLANVAMLAWLAQPTPPSGREPERLAQQLNADRITVIDPEAAAAQAVQERLAAHRAAQEKLAAQQAQQPQQPQQPQPGQQGPQPPPANANAAAPSPAPSPPPAAAGDAAGSSSSLAQAVCVELGDFSAQAAESFEPQLSRLSMTGIPQRRIVRPPPSYMVFVPPQPTESAAVKRLEELRAKGFADSGVIRDGSPRRWGVSAGLFSKEETAIAQLDKLHQAGIADARMGEHPLNSTRYAYRLPGVTAAGATRLAAVASGYAGVTMRPCK